MNFKQLLTFTLALFSLSATAGPGKELALAENLYNDAAEANNSKIPIVVLVTATYCEYCEVIKEEVFQFMTEDERFILRELVVDGGWDLRDFNGEENSPYKVARRYRASLTPTVLFLGPDGEQLADPLIGVLTLDYYSAYLDINVGKATQKLAL